MVLSGSQDYDCILFGAPRMVRNLTITGGKANLELINLETMLTHLKLPENNWLTLPSW